MKISHEVPLCFLKESLKWNDYQYVLPHLIDQYPQYKTHMLEYREKPDSFIICDNGLFEGVNHTTEDLLDKIKHLEEKNAILEKELNDTKEHLKKYTAPKRSKVYYENHKEEIQLKTKDRVIPQDKKKEYNKNYYLRKKEKNKESNNLETLRQIT